MVKKILRQINRINFLAIFLDIVRCFIASCGMVFLMMFFDFEGAAGILATKEHQRTTVFILCYFLAILKFSLGFIAGEKGRWIRKPDHESDSLSEADWISERQKELAAHKNKTTAIHEAGHAVMAYLQKAEDFRVYFSCVTAKVITVFGDTAEDVRKWILVKYSGAVAEEIMLGRFHQGSMGDPKSDFSTATELIKEYIVMTNPDVSKSLLDEELSTQIIFLSREFYQEAKELLSQNKTMIEIISSKLMETNQLSKEEIIQLLSGSSSNKAKD